MGWDRKQFQAKRRQPRHARRLSCPSTCRECGRDVGMSQLLVRLGGLCRNCFEVVRASGAADMASQ